MNESAVLSVWGLQAVMRLWCQSWAGVCQRFGGHLLRQSVPCHVGQPWPTDR